MAVDIEALRQAITDASSCGASYENVLLLTAAAAELEQLQREYRELHCAVWVCPLDEYEHDHAATVKEAEKDAREAHGYRHQLKEQTDG